MKKITLIITMIAMATTTRAESLSSAPASALLNSFLAEYSKTEASWKKEIRLNERPGFIQPGRQLGVSDTMGYFSYIPKTWSDLTPTEQHELLTDPRLKAFLISSRKGSEQIVKDGQAMTAIDGGTTSTNVISAKMPTNNKITSTPLLISLNAEKISETPIGQPIQIDIPNANAN